MLLISLQISFSKVRAKGISVTDIRTLSNNFDGTFLQK